VATGPPHLSWIALMLYFFGLPVPLTFLPNACCNLLCRAPLDRDLSRAWWWLNESVTETDLTIYPSEMFCSSACYEKVIQAVIKEPSLRANGDVNDYPGIVGLKYIASLMPGQASRKMEEKYRRETSEQIEKWRREKAEAPVKAEQEISAWLKKCIFHAAREAREEAKKEADRQLNREIREARERSELRYIEIKYELKRNALKKKEEQEALDAQREQAELDNQLLDQDRLGAVVPIPERTRFEHTLIVGGSGAGKTTLLQQIILDDLAKPNPPAMVVLDPKGLMIKRLQRLAVFNPDNGRLKDRIIVVDPTIDPPPALNMFDPGTRRFHMWSPQMRMQVENQLIELFGYIFSAAGFKLTEKQQIDFGYVVRLMYEIDNANVETLLDILDDPAKNLETFAFRAYVERLHPMAQRFFRNEFFTEFKESKGQIKARLYMVLQHPVFIAALSATHNAINLIEAINEGKIILVNTNSTLLGDRASALLGRYFIATTLNAAFARVALKAPWPPAFLIIDEFQEYADEIKTPQMLRLAREYNLGIVMATQILHDKPFTDGLRNQLSTNTSIKYAASVEAQDLTYITRDMHCDSQFITARKVTPTHVNFACFARNVVDHPMSIHVPLGNVEAQPQMTDGQLQKFLDINAQRLSAETHKAEAPLAGASRPATEATGVVDPILPRPPKSTPPAAVENESPEKW